MSDHAALKDKPVADAERLFREVHDLPTEERQVGGLRGFLGKLTVLTGVGSTRCA